MLRTKFFFKNCLIFYWQIVFWPLVYSIKTAKTRHGKIRQFLKKNLVRNIFYPWHHKSPEKCHIELVESKMAERFFFLVSVDHSGCEENFSFLLHPYPDPCKKSCSTQKFWLQKLICVFFHSWKKSANQLFSV